MQRTYIRLFVLAATLAVLVTTLVACGGGRMG